jgi:hypothetical protein
MSHLEFLAGSIGTGALDKRHQQFRVKVGSGEQDAHSVEYDAARLQ